VVSLSGLRRVIAALEPRYTLPSDTYFRTTLIPELYQSISSKVLEVLASASYVSFTTDSWSTSQCTESLLSITAHWVTQSWDRQSAVLAASPISGSHTADNIADLVQKLTVTWNVRSKVHVFLRDNARNMIAGLRDAGVQSLSCFSHNLQLCVKSGLTSQRAVIDAVECLPQCCNSLLALCSRQRKTGQDPGDGARSSSSFDHAGRSYSVGLNYESVGSDKVK